MTTPQNDSVRAVLAGYERGDIDFPGLIQAVATLPCPDPDDGQPEDWAEVYRRAEEMPDDNDPFWIEVAEDLDILTPEEAEQLFDALEQEGI